MSNSHPTFKERLAGCFNLKSLTLTFGLVAISYLIGHYVPSVVLASRVMWDAIESAYAPMPDGSRDISKFRVVLITPNDYERMFRSSSPLDSDGLAKLIAVVLKRAPKKVYVDIDTSTAKFRDLQYRVGYYLFCLSGACPEGNFQTESQALCDGRLPPDPKVVSATATEREQAIKNVVWARGVEIGEDGSWVKPLPVLGGQDENVRHESAVVAIQPDIDGRVRDLPEKLPGEALWESAANELNEGWKKPGKDSRPLLAPALQRVQRHIINASSLVADSGASADLQNAVVFLGGSYDAADRFYAADGNPHPGILMLAAGSLAYATDGFVYEHPWVEIVIKVVLALAILVMNHEVVQPWLRLLGLTAVFIVTCVFALVLAQTMSWILSLAGLLLSMLVEQSVEGTLSAAHK